MTVFTKSTPATLSAAMSKMQERWDVAYALNAGQEAVRAMGVKLMPAYPEETQANYQHRLKASKYPNLIQDIVTGLVDKACAKAIAIEEGSVGPELAALCENDLDGRGSNLNTVARKILDAGVLYGLSLIYINAPSVPEGTPEPRSVADEKRLGIRPIWEIVDPRDIIAAKSGMVNGRQEFTHLRLRWNDVVTDGYDEVEVERVLEMNRVRAGDTWQPATWVIWQKKDKANRQEWTEVKTGTFPDRIPVVAFSTAPRRSDNWIIDLPLQSALDLQVQLYIQESESANVRILTSNPMLVGEGVTPIMGKNGEIQPLKVGPGATLYAPAIDGKASGTWKYIEPQGTTLSSLADEIKRTEMQLRELGRQPLQPYSGASLTVISTAVAAQKGNSAVQVWSLLLKDALEQALQITAERFVTEKSDPIVRISSDLQADLLGTQGLAELQNARKNKDLSQETFWKEWVRRGQLAPDFDADAEKELLLKESPDPDGEDDIEAATTPRRAMNSNR